MFARSNKNFLCRKRLQLCILQTNLQWERERERDRETERDRERDRMVGWRERKYFKGTNFLVPFLISKDLMQRCGLVHIATIMKNQSKVYRGGCIEYQRPASTAPVRALSDWPGSITLLSPKPRINRYTQSGINFCWSKQYTKAWFLKSCQCQNICPTRFSW